MSIGASLLRQCCKPAGWLGRLNLRSMNRRHLALTEWALSRVTIEPGFTILDIGCGGGRTVARLAGLADKGKVIGVDYSETSVAVSRETNDRAIAAGRVEIHEASVSRLPFEDATFDLAVAVETHYYWPNLDADLREVRRVLKPGGTLAIVAESYKGGKHDARLQRLEQLNERGIMQWAHLTVAEHANLLARAGYDGVRVVEDYEKGWLCALGSRLQNLHPER